MFNARYPGDYSLQILSKELNFTYLLKLSSKYGALSKNGTWNGLMGMITKDQADITGAGLAVTEARARAVTFGRAIEEVEWTLISGDSAVPDVNPWIYFEVFPASAWFLSSVIVICISICFAITNYSGINIMHDKFDSESFTILNGLSLSLTFFRQIYYEVKIKSKSSKLLFIASTVSTYLLFIHFTSYLTASSTYSEKNQIGSFADVLSGGYKVITWENGALHDSLRYSKLGTAMYEVYHKTMDNKPDAFLRSYSEVPRILAHKKTLIYDGDLYSSGQLDGVTFLDIQGLSDVNWFASWK